MIRIVLISIPVFIYFYDRSELKTSIIAVLFIFLLDSFFFVKSVEITKHELILHYFFRTKLITITSIRKAEKSTWDSYKKITLYLVDGPMEILEGFVYSKADILLIIDAINNKIGSQEIKGSDSIRSKRSKGQTRKRLKRD